MIDKAASVGGLFLFWKFGCGEKIGLCSINPLTWHWGRQHDARRRDEIKLALFAKSVIYPLILVSYSVADTDVSAISCTRPICLPSARVPTSFKNWNSFFAYRHPAL
jgi:hypothetical protein